MEIKEKSTDQTTLKTAYKQSVWSVEMMFCLVYVSMYNKNNCARLYV